jgi:hypothetical protein
MPFPGRRARSARFTALDRSLKRPNAGRAASPASVLKRSACWRRAANLVLEGAYERIIVGNSYGDIPLGLYVIRGENVVLLGQVVGSTPLALSNSPIRTLCGNKR